MNFNSNDSFNNSIFSSNNSLENDNSETNINENNNLYDTPPVLDEIKNLNDAPTYEAPSMDALGLNNYNNENIKLSNLNDPLDAYENNSINLSNFNPAANDINNSISNNIENNNFSFQKEENNKLESTFNSSNNTFNSDIFDSNGNIKQEVLDNLGIKNNVSAEDTVKEYKKNDFNKEGQTEENKEYEIINEPILNQDSNLETKIDEESDSDLKNDNEELAKEIPNEENQEKLTDISSLGIDAYNEPDFLDITDDEEQLNDDEDSITKIKNLINELTKKGEKIKLEEFDFENMHQLIVIIEKEEK